MSKQYRKNSSSPSMISVGWLFADLLLALAVLFLLVNTVGSPLKPKPISKKAVVTPTLTPIPTQLPRLELTFHEFKINIDPSALLNDSQSTINAVKQQVRAQAFLQGRSAGLVIAYGGAPDTSQIGQAQVIAGKMYNILKMLGKEGFAFARASYYNTLYNLYSPNTIVILDIYLFANS